MQEEDPAAEEKPIQADGLPRESGCSRPADNASRYEVYQWGLKNKPCWNNDAAEQPLSPARFTSDSMESSSGSKKRPAHFFQASDFVRPDIADNRFLLSESPKRSFKLEQAACFVFPNATRRFSKASGLPLFTFRTNLKPSVERAGYPGNHPCFLQKTLSDQTNGLP